MTPSLRAFAPPSAGAVVAALSAAGVDLVHIVCGGWGATIVVAAGDERAAVGALSELELEPRTLVA